jgi:hypothetical protein
LIKGSPFYPSKAPLVEKLELPYHPGLERVSSGRAFPEGMVHSLARGNLTRLFWGPVGWSGHRNFGLGGLVLGLFAAVAFVRGIARRRHRGVLLYLFSGAVLVTLLFLGSSTLALRTIWMGILGRLLVSAYAPAFLCASLLPRRIAFAGFGLATIASLEHTLPLGWSRAMVLPAVLLLIAAVAVSGAGFLLHRSLRDSTTGLWRGAVLAAAFVALYVPWDALRHRVRYSIYAETGDMADAFDGLPLHRRFPTQLPIWRFLDTPEVKEIAVAAGWEDTGPNQFLYPLLGSRLQNRLTYVPITADGRDSDLWYVERRSRADARSWIARVEAVEPDYLVGLAPDTPEREWVESRPDRFELLPVDPAGDNWIARLR